MVLTVIEQIEKYVRRVKIDEMIDRLYQQEDEVFFGHGLSSFEFDSIVSQVNKDKRKALSIGQFLIGKMSQKGLIQQELADRAGLSKSYLSNILKGVAASKYRLIRIALVLELNLEETKELLEIGGKSFENTLKDKIIVACISLEVFDLIKVEEALNKVENAKETLY